MISSRLKFRNIKQRKLTAFILLKFLTVKSPLSNLINWLYNRRK